MKLLKSAKAVSPLVALIILVVVTVVGGLVAFAVYRNATSVASQKVAVAFENLKLVKTKTTIVFAGNLRNVGTKPIEEVTIRLHNETECSVPSITSSNPLEPGHSVGVLLTSQLHADYYTVGLGYMVAVHVLAVDGSTFSDVRQVTCIGWGGSTHPKGDVLWDILDEDFFGQGNWEVMPDNPPYYTSNVEWLPDGKVRMFTSGFSLTGIIDSEEPLVTSSYPLPDQVTIEFKVKLHQDTSLLLRFQVGIYCADLEVRTNGAYPSKVRMHNQDVPTEILDDVWYTFRMVINEGSCNLYKKTDASPWEFVATWPSLFVSSDNYLYATQVAWRSGTAEVVMDYLKIASGIHPPS